MKQVVFFRGDKGITKISLSLKPNLPNRVKLVQIFDTNNYSLIKISIPLESMKDGRLVVHAELNVILDKSKMQSRKDSSQEESKPML